MFTDDIPMKGTEQISKFEDSWRRLSSVTSSIVPKSSPEDLGIITDADELKATVVKKMQEYLGVDKTQVYQDILMQSDAGTVCCDAIFLGPRALYIVQCCAWSGQVYAASEWEAWNICKGGKRVEVPSPIQQVTDIAHALYARLQLDIPTYVMIVFADTTEFKKGVQVPIPSYIYGCHLENMYSAVYRMLQRQPAYLSEDIYAKVQDVLNSFQHK